jgi:hypothetical protein
MAPLAYDMRVGIVGGKEARRPHGAARLRRRRARYAGIAMEIGIEPAARHAADLGIAPVLIAPACCAGHADAAQRSRPQPSALRRLRKLVCDAGAFNNKGVDGRDI